MIAALRTFWGVPEAEFMALGTLFSVAEALLQKTQNEAERTHVNTVECRAAFHASSRWLREPSREAENFL